MENVRVEWQGGCILEYHTKLLLQHILFCCYGTKIGVINESISLKSYPNYYTVKYMERRLGCDFNKIVRATLYIDLYNHIFKFYKDL